MPRGVAVDNSAGADKGDVYVVDTANNVVDQFGKSAGVEVYLSQITGTGVANPAPAFSGPTGVAVDSVGDVWVADTGNGVLDEFEPEAGGKYKYLGQLSESSIPLADRGNGIFGPGGVAVDSLGDVWVTDTANGVVDEFSSSGVFMSQLSESSIPPADQGNGTFAPVGVAVDDSSPENVYAIDSSNGVVDVFSSSAGTDTFVSQLSNPTSSPPEAVTVDRSSNEAYVVYRDGEVVTYDSSGNVLSRFGPGSISPCTGFCEAVGGGPGVWGIGVESTGDLYVSNSYEWEFFGNQHRVNQVVSFALATIPDAMTEEPATSVTATSATVPGKVNPEETSVTACEFEYGLEATYGQMAPCAQELSTLTGNVFLPVSAKLTGLEPSATYHYQLVASDANGNSENEGKDKELTTPGMPPAVVSESASGVTQTGATLKAQINPENQETSYSFEYSTGRTGESLNSPTTVPGGPNIPAGLSNQPASGDIAAGLAPDTLYYYRVIASNGITNGNGTTDGPIQTFLTLPSTPATDGFSSITQDSATVSGSFNPGGVDTHYYFQYGAGPASIGYWQGQTPSIDAGSGTNAVEPEAGLSGLQALTTYHYRLVAANASGESYGAWQELTTLSAPSEALGPVIVTTNSALIEVAVSPAPGTTYQMEYGPGTSYGQSVPVPAGEAGSGSQLLSVELAGLNPYEIYHYRLNAISAAGTSYGPDQQFLTEPLAPLVSIGAAQSVGENSATLTGTVNPQGINTTYYFQYGTSESYGASVPLAPAYAGAASAALGEMASIIGLAPSTTYHFRLVATSRGGTVYGAGQTFTTAATAVTAITPKVTPPPKKTTTPKVLTRAQKLAKALKACAKKGKKQRAGCERQAHKQYGSAVKKKIKKKR
ncbi:MAG TPA: NHL repeat-containing protein [Solirubrobacteraceae bacterium]